MSSVKAALWYRMVGLGGNEKKETITTTTTTTKTQVKQIDYPMWFGF
jgi:hypothetical protein